MVLLKMGPMGPRGLGPKLFPTASQIFFSFRDFGRPKNAKMCISKKICVCFEIFAILANVDLNFRLDIFKIAI